MQAEFDIPATMRDGTILRADVYRPQGDGPWPVLVHRTPYGKQAIGAWLNLNAVEATLRGYIVVQQDTRGRYSSNGEWLPWAHERDDGYDTVEWAARLEGSNGKVGMVGQSYTGSTQWSAAVMRPPSLFAIAPMVTWSEPTEGLLSRGGAIELGLNAWWSLSQSLAQFPKVAQATEELDSLTRATIQEWDGLAVKGYWELPSGVLPGIVRTGQPDIGIARALAHPETTAESRVADRYDDVQVPSLNVAGWYDVFQQGSIDNYVAMRERGIPTSLVIGPWTHTSLYGLAAGQTGEVNFGVAAATPAGSPSLTTMQLDWFDRWLAAESVESRQTPNVKIFVMGINQWRDEENWPLARSIDTPLFLRDGAATDFEGPGPDEGASSYEYDPTAPVLTRGGALIMATEFPNGPADQAITESRADVLVFTSAPLEDDLEVTGKVRAVLFAASDAQSTDWVVRLCDVEPGGRSINVVDGIIRSTQKASAISKLTIDLWSTSIVFRAGHRLRVQVTSSNFPRWDRNPNTGESTATAVHMITAHQSVYHNADHPSHLLLPVVPAGASTLNPQSV